MKTNRFLICVLFVLVLVTAGCSNKIKTSNNEDLTRELKEFTIKASKWKFEPSIITVNKGDKVRIIAESLDVPHGLAIDEYGVNLYLDGFKPKTAEFIADKAGIFIFYCNVPCGAGHSKMRGKLIVKG